MTVTVTAEGVAAMCAALALLAGIGLFAVKAMIDHATLQWREWINGSFMRAATVQAELRAIRAQVGIPEPE